MKPNTYCSFCGARFPEGLGWPRTCSTCNNTTYRNPLPVAVVLVPVGAGLLLVRRSIVPHAGKLALPGGYINLGESWQAAGAREVAEETGLVVDPATIREFRVRSAPDGTVLIFGVSAPVEVRAVAGFQPTAEAAECVIADAPAELAFPLHTEAVAAYFQRRGPAE
jgi:ADP-ribose pyrophosphatase YjhB (NUDIX family)